MTLTSNISRTAESNLGYSLGLEVVRDQRKSNSA